jgi:hypothetical protein
MAKKKWSDIAPEQRAGIIVLGAVQLALAATAWTDLARRPASQVNGRKAVWAVVIAFNTIGPIAYFARGRTRGPRTPAL